MAEESRPTTGIIVLGPYRSGTSVTSKVLSSLGVDFGPKKHLLRADLRNPSGFYERQDVNDANNALIRSAGKTLGDPGDPQALATQGDLQSLQLADMSWARQADPWGIKDPRMCATLTAWIASGIVARDNLKIVHVRRHLDASLRSAMAFDPIRNFCDGSEQGVRNMLQSYDEMAAWHVAQLQVPTIEIPYESLLKNPTKTVNQLAQFLEVDDERRIHRATAVIGKGKWMFAMHLKRYLIRAPIRVFRMITGQSPKRPRSS